MWFIVNAALGILFKQGIVEYLLERGLFLYNLTGPAYSAASQVAICNTVQFLATYFLFPGSFRGGFLPITGKYVPAILGGVNMLIQSSLFSNVAGKETILMESAFSLLIFCLLVGKFPGSFSLCEIAFISQASTFYFSQYMGATALFSKMCYLFLNLPALIGVAFLFINFLINKREASYFLALIVGGYAIFNEAKYELMDFVTDAFSESYSTTVCIFYVVVLALGCVFIDRIKKEGALSSITIRKLFHLLAFLVFMVGIYYTPKMQKVVFAKALFVFFILELTRYVFSQHWLVVKYYELITSFIEEKEPNNMVIAHILLLFACSHPYFVNYNLGFSTYTAFFSRIAGLLVIGLQDSFGAIVGNTYGKTKFFKTAKSVEGLVAGFLILVAAAYLVNSFLFPSFVISSQLWTRMAIGFFAINVVEAYTKQTNAIVLPLIFTGILQAIFE